MMTVMTAGDALGLAPPGWTAADDGRIAVPPVATAGLGVPDEEGAHQIRSKTPLAHTARGSAGEARREHDVGRSGRDEQGPGHGGEDADGALGDREPHAVAQELGEVLRVL